MIPRSYLYVPGDQPDKLASALRRGADALILDLEDAVAPGAKDAGRAAVGDFLDGVDGVDGVDSGDSAGAAPASAAGSGSMSAQLWVRINPGDAGLVDIAAVWRPALTGVMLAKAESLADLERIDRALAESEAAAGAPVGRTAVVPLLESAAAVLSASPIAAGPRVSRLQIGEADLGSELGLDAGAGGDQVRRTVRSMVILASAAAGIDPPVAPISTDFRDLEALRASTAMLAGMGFLGRACIHPAQIAVVNEVFTPDPSAVAQARSLVARFDAALAQGRGVMVADDGTMLDEAVVRRARRLLDLAGERQQRA